mmetsp:Transcript_86949/g.246456  ORF Transcript_86949/g.246456 Transcript_86949/m.246456 type:complete len:104 (-) Transcript_86949:430-741(-)
MLVRRDFVVSGDVCVRLYCSNLGMAVELDRNNHSKMIDICLAFFKSEGYKAGKLMCDGQTNLSTEAVHLFCKDIEELVKVRFKLPKFLNFTSYTFDTRGNTYL